METRSIIASATLLYGGFMYWRLRLLKKRPADGKSLGPWFLHQFSVAYASTCASIMGVRIVSEGGEGLKAKPSKNPIYVWHPHGFVSYVPSFMMGGKALGGEPHGYEWFGTCLPTLFKIPWFAEVMHLNNARPVDSKTIDAILSKGKGLAIQPGGVKEQSNTRDDQEQAFFPTRLGFIRKAIKFGVPLVPLYIFGENQLFKRVAGLDWLSKAIHKATGMMWPFILGKWNMPMAIFFPRATDVHIRWGKPVEVGPADENPSDERIQEVFEKYIAELQHVFDEHAKDCLPAEIAAKGLKIHRPGDKKKD